MPTQFPEVIELSDLNGLNGFKINGITMDDKSGFSVSQAGDINSDGIDDLIIGAPGLYISGKTGQSYVIFGDVSIGNSGTLELSSLNGSNGFVLKGITSGDFIGCSVSNAGDVNADGIDDLIIGAPNASPNGPKSGQSYVIFGGLSVGGAGVIELSSLNGANGFKINGIVTYDNSGYSVSQAGDINADGIDDLIIGAPWADPNGASSGQSYVVFGGVDVGATGSIELSNLNGVNGFMLNGVANYDHSGISVSTTGDINIDGLVDFVIGAPGFFSDSGQSYVVFGGANVGSTGTIELSNLNGINGFKLNGRGDESSGDSISDAGDVNADGIADLIIGAPDANSNGPDSGRTYVLFGGASVGGSGTLKLSNLNGANGFTLNGIRGGDKSGSSISSLSDINGDGVADILIGARSADPNDSSSGQSYVVFGSTAVGVTGIFQLSNLNGSNGFKINGITVGDGSGTSVSRLGDINADGVADLIIGAPGSDPNGSRSGQSYVVFGDVKPPTLIRNQFTVIQGEQLTLANTMLALETFNS